jgi:predicted ATPase
MTTLSKEVRKLAKSWTTGNWPKHLESLEIHGLRGWQGERVTFNFPFVAIVGENGVGKSTLLQTAASVYRYNENSFYASDFFPTTPWENVQNVTLKASIREGNQTLISRVRKATTRWHGNQERRIRPVRYLDLRRTQPIYARVGYSKLVKGSAKEVSAEEFDENRLNRFSSIVGKKLTRARISTTTANKGRTVPVISIDSGEYSGFHQGAGEATLADLIALDMPKYSLVLIDEIETSLHPRAQRRLIRDLAEICRLQHLQIIVTTHSSYVLEELPLEARIQVLNTVDGKQIMTGISAQFALTQMDESTYPEVDIYVEDINAKILVEEIIVKYKPNFINRVQIIPFGAASVGQALGKMVYEDKFPRPSIVILDADQNQSAGCLLLPGDDAPERVIFEALDQKKWPLIAQRINRSHSSLVDQAKRALTLPDHHDWIRQIADHLIIGGDELWRAFSSVWVETCTIEEQVAEIIEAIQDSLAG